MANIANSMEYIYSYFYIHQYLFSVNDLMNAMVALYIYMYMKYTGIFIFMCIYLNVCVATYEAFDVHIFIEGCDECLCVHKYIYII